MRRWWTAGVAVGPWLLAVGPPHPASAQTAGTATPAPGAARAITTTITPADTYAGSYSGGVTLTLVAGP